MSNLNPKLSALEVYASKAIAIEAKKDPNIVSLSFGEPEFGPPKYALKEIEEQDLNLVSFLDSVKRYEDPRGSLKLREAISDWYKRRYNLTIDPDKEIMITHGGVEAITLALLCTSEAGDSIAITDPSYMLYERTVQTLERKACSLKRTSGNDEYQKLMTDVVSLETLQSCKTLIINSPENPSGYVLDENERKLITEYSNQTGLWIIHDEVYDTMAFSRKHKPLLSENSKNIILINSFSKKFGMPGLRIGWMVASEAVINLASKIHDYLYLGVNIQYEKIATRLLSDERNEQWLLMNTQKIHQRIETALEVLTDEKGFTWPRKPLGAMFLFPNVRKLYDLMPEEYKLKNFSVGEAVAKYLMKEKKVAVVPGSVYGSESADHIRLVLCSTEHDFNLAMQRLRE